MLLSCRCLYNLVEANPGASSSISHHKGVGVLVGKLLEIEYIDMAETVLKVSYCLNTGPGMYLYRLSFCHLKG